MAPRLDQFAKRFCVRIDIDENLKARLPPRLQPASEFAKVGVTQGRKRSGRLGHQALARIIKDDRGILARQSRLTLKRDPVCRHVGSEQRMAGCEGGLAAHVEQGNLLPQQQHGADLRGGHGIQGQRHRGRAGGMDKACMVATAISTAIPAGNFGQGRTFIPVKTQYLERRGIECRIRNGLRPRKSARAVTACWSMRLLITPSICSIRKASSQAGIRGPGCSRVMTSPKSSASISRDFTPKRTASRACPVVRWMWPNARVSS